MHRSVKTYNHQPKSGALSPATAAPARITSERLLNGAAEIIIEHQGRDYRLRLTQNGKLILTA
ncbi:MAG TPA: hemin uptake protein HemP [Burkholderiales bacterium]|nr:hemin uptake protein HemP [Burkholderiales bacterium]